MKRILFMVMKSIIFVPYYFFALLYYASEKHRDYDKAFVVCEKIVNRALKTGNVKVEVIDKEKLPDKDGYLLTPNHQGMFDMLVMLHALDKSFAFVAKKEVSEVLVVKQVMQGLGSYSIDREDLRQSMRVIGEVAKDLKKGRNFVIFPEGTRSKNGNNLLEFKGGSFKAAMKVKAPIVPCAMIDSYKVFDTNSIKQETVKIVFLDPIYSSEYEGMSTNEVAELVRDKIQTKIDSLA